LLHFWGEKASISEEEENIGKGRRNPAEIFLTKSLEKKSRGGRFFCEQVPLKGGAPKWEGKKGLSQFSTILLGKEDPSGKRKTPIGRWRGNGRGVDAYRRGGKFSFGEEFWGRKSSRDAFVLLWIFSPFGRGGKTGSFSLKRDKKKGEEGKKKLDSLNIPSPEPGLLRGKKRGGKKTKNRLGKGVSPAYEGKGESPERRGGKGACFEERGKKV